MKIISKHHANKLRSPDTYVIKYDKGKYNYPSDLVGQEVSQVTDGLLAVYTETRHDKDGKYIQLMALKER